MTDELTPTATHAGGVAPAKENERIPLANDGTRTKALVGSLCLFQPLRDERWHLDGDERTVTIVRVVEIEPDGTWADHGDLPFFWNVVRSQLNEQSNDDFPWVVGRITRAQKSRDPKKSPPYVLVSPTPEETERGGDVLAAWNKAPAPTFAPPASDGEDEKEEPF